MELTDLRIDLAGHYARNGYLVGPLLSPIQMSRIADTSWCYLRSRGVGAPDLTCCRYRRGDRQLQPEYDAARDTVTPQERPQPAAPIRFGDIVRQIPAAAEVAMDADTLFLAADVTGAASVDLVASELLYQPAHSSPPPDRDASHSEAEVTTANGDPALEPDLRAIIAVDDQFDDGGGLHLIPGSHRPGARRGAAYSVPLPAGWVAMLHPRLSYSRAANSSHVPRRCLILDYAADSPGASTPAARQG